MGGRAKRILPASVQPQLFLKEREGSLRQEALGLGAPCTPAPAVLRPGAAVNWLAELRRTIF